MILKHLYVLSLDTGGAVFFGYPVEHQFKTDGRIDNLASYINGLCHACQEGAQTLQHAREYGDFMEWLHEVKYKYMPEGWPTKLFRDSGRNHELAIEEFWGLLHEYLLFTRPAWFIEINAQPIPGLWVRGGDGLPCKDDVRLPEHVQATGGRE